MRRKEERGNVSFTSYKNGIIHYYTLFIRWIILLYLVLLFIFINILLSIKDFWVCGVCVWVCLYVNSIHWIRILLYDSRFISAFRCCHDVASIRIPFFCPIVYWVRGCCEQLSRMRANKWNSHEIYDKYENKNISLVNFFFIVIVTYFIFIRCYFSLAYFSYFSSLFLQYMARYIRRTYQKGFQFDSTHFLAQLRIECPKSLHRCQHLVCVAGGMNVSIAPRSLILNAGQNMHATCDTWQTHRSHP